MGNAFFRGLLANQAQDASDSSDEGLEPKYLLEQYASQVLDFSTQYGSDRSFSYTAANCLGACSCLTTNKFSTQFCFDNSALISGAPVKFPNYGDFPQTYVMRTYGRWLEKV